MAKTRFELLVDEAEREAWEAAAKAEGMTLAAWVRRSANRCVKAMIFVVDEPNESRLTAAPPRLVLCGRCARIGAPSCPECRAAAMRSQ